jgi:hypothetical protein
MRCADTLAEPHSSRSWIGGDAPSLNRGAVSLNRGAVKRARPVRRRAHLRVAPATPAVRARRRAPPAARATPRASRPARPRTATPPGAPRHLARVEHQIHRARSTPRDIAISSRGSLFDGEALFVNGEVLSAHGRALGPDPRAARAGNIPAQLGPLMERDRRRTARPLRARCPDRDTGRARMDPGRCGAAVEQPLARRPEDAQEHLALGELAEPDGGTCRRCTSSIGLPSSTRATLRTCSSAGESTAAYSASMRRPSPRSPSRHRGGHRGRVRAERQATRTAAQTVGPVCDGGGRGTP